MLAPASINLRQSVNRPLWQACEGTHTKKETGSQETYFGRKTLNAWLWVTWDHPTPSTNWWNIIPNPSTNKWIVLTCLLLISLLRKMVSLWNGICRNQNICLLSSLTCFLNVITEGYEDQPFVLEGFRRNIYWWTIFQDLYSYNPWKMIIV